MSDNKKVIIFIKDEETENGYRITLFHYKPEDLTNDKLSEGFELTLSSVNKPQVNKDQNAVPYFKEGKVNWVIVDKTTIEE